MERAGCNLCWLFRSRARGECCDRLTKRDRRLVTAPTALPLAKKVKFNLESVYVQLLTAITSSAGTIYSELRNDRQW